MSLDRWQLKPLGQVKERVLSQSHSNIRGTDIFLKEKNHKIIESRMKNMVSYEIKK